MGKLIFLVIGLLIMALAFSPLRTHSITFKVVDEQQRPLLSNDVYVFDGDVKFDAAGIDPMPYGLGANQRSGFIAALKTDEKGTFTFDIDGNPKNYCFRTGMTTLPACIERASDIGHTRANEHLRVIVFKPGSSEVAANDIYSLKNKTVKTLTSDGGVEEHPFTMVMLVARPIAAPQAPDAQ